MTNKWKISVTTSESCTVQYNGGLIWPGRRRQLQNQLSNNPRFQEPNIN